MMFSIKCYNYIIRGGLFDHIGFGFYRYSVDEKWLVPHFEKMLYDNALLGIVYAKAYEITKDPLYKEIVEKIFEFILSEMISEEGGFYAALDAESEGEEGKYYVFEYREIIDILGYELAELYCNHYNITEKGNFEGKNIPNLIGKDFNSINNIEKQKLETARERLFAYRDNRIKPHRDEKILTSWNGLMVGSLAYGGKVLDNMDYINRAKKAADFIIANSLDKEGHLLSIYIDGKSYNLGFLEDYAFLVYGLLTLYGVTKDQVYLNISKRLKEDMKKLFWDDKDGGYFYYSNISEKLILRPKDYYDGAIPSGNSIALFSLANLYVITKDEDLYKRFQELLYSFGDNLNNNPSSYLYSILALIKLRI